MTNGPLRTNPFLILVALAAAANLNVTGHLSSSALAEAKAVEFLTREVPAWSKGNGCFSCHNNGDGARALYRATQRGYRIPANALADTTAWVTQPDRWDKNKDDSSFNDRRLANIQFAASLTAALEAGHATDPVPLREAARKLAVDQESDGTWRIGPGNTLGSPTTYGTALASYMALRVLKKAEALEASDAIGKAEVWFRRARPKDVLAAATVLLAMQDDSGQPDRFRQEELMTLIHRAQTHDGGWGPYLDSPPEPFDTAVVLLSLAGLRLPDAKVDGWIRRGRSFLAARQNPDGSWPATTRPPGGESYAQQISTTGWSTLALFATRDTPFRAGALPGWKHIRPGPQKSTRDVGWGRSGLEPGRLRHLVPAFGAK